MNTIDPKKMKTEQVERTAINGQIAEILGLLEACPVHRLHRNAFCQCVCRSGRQRQRLSFGLHRQSRAAPARTWVVRTSTISTTSMDDDKTPANSNEKAYVRDLRAECDEDRPVEQLRALDSFVLTGAIQAFPGIEGRQAVSAPHDVGARISEAGRARRGGQRFQGLVEVGGVQPGKESLEAGKALGEDFAVVSAARGSELANPSSFGELEEFIGAAYDKISVGTSPVIVVNGAAGEGLQTGFPRLPGNGEYGRSLSAEQS